MPGMLFVVGVPTALTERRLRQEQRLISKDNVPTNDPLPLEKMLDELLQKLEIEYATWSLDKAGSYFQVVFCTAAGDDCENCLHCLSQLGIGKKFNSNVSVTPCNVFLQGVAGDPGSNDSDEESEMTKRWNSFVQSIRSKLTVQQVVDGVRAGAECSFDYMALVLTADMIAAVGLVENNSVNIVAAMLVSPLMGPIMAVTFGAIIVDWKLMRIGVVSEAVGMLISVVFGFIFGLLVGDASVTAPWGSGDWPTAEMRGRGHYRSLWIGILWALPSGTGVALALLQGNAGPLIGVAISASLLPPLVNCGMMWGLACVYCIHNGIKLPYNAGEPLDPGFNSTYKPVYSDWMPAELGAMGIISFCLTLINFCCIFITAIIVLKVKEVAAPYVSPPDLRRFWEHDLKLTRSANRSTARRSRFPDAADELMSEVSELPEGERDATLRAAVREAMGDRTLRAVQRCSFYSGAAAHVAADAPGAEEGPGTAVATGAGAGVSEGGGEENLLRSLLKGSVRRARGGGRLGAGGGSLRQPLSRSLRLPDRRSLHGAADTAAERVSWLRQQGVGQGGSPRRLSSALPTILESGKRASLTERARAASHDALHALATAPRRLVRSPAPAPAAPAAAAAIFQRSDTETVSLTHAEDA